MSFASDKDTRGDMSLVWRHVRKSAKRVCREADADFRTATPSVPKLT